MTLRTHIENMVSAITLNQKIDIKNFASKASGVEYNPENFPGVVFRVREPKLAMLIFSSGKVICTGARDKKDIETALEKLRKKLNEAGIRLRGKPKVEIQNIVASSDLELKINLDLLATECVNTEYEPEQFPGLVFRLEQPKTVMLIFRSGKIIITGAKNTSDIKKAAEETKKMVLEYKAIF
ncbi:MAG: TATA-box-binding protein [Candidatus Altiarchaeales archaeon]|nr:TATA-box-binding protein [Candidatus Altiarchaeales archaeon]